MSTTHRIEQKLRKVWFIMMKGNLGVEERKGKLKEIIRKDVM